MTVEENILIGFTKPQSELHKELVDTMKKIGWNLELNRKANTLSIAEQQLVELLRGFAQTCKDTRFWMSRQVHLLLKR